MTEETSTKDCSRNIPEICSVDDSGTFAKARELGRELNTFSLKIKLLDEKCQPNTADESGNAGYDLRSRIETILPPMSGLTIPLGICASFPPTHVGLLFDRSGIASKKLVGKLAGVIDSSYRGEWHIVLFNHSRVAFEIKKGDRICQVLFQEVSKPTIQFVDSLEETSRGSDGFGSSGVK